MFAACVFSLLLAAGTKDSEPTPLSTFAVTDVAGKKHTAADWAKAKAVVLLFIGTDCPVSNFYCPEYVRLTKKFADRGALFYAIHPDPYVTIKDAREHLAEYGLPFPVILDPNHAVTKHTGIRVVPEAVVLSPRGRILYRGRIDDRYNAKGMRREVPTTRDLEDAVSAILGGRMPAVVHTEAFGCLLPEPKK